MSPGYPCNIRSKGQRSRSHGHKVQKHIEGDRVAGASLHSTECSASSFFNYANSLKVTSVTWLSVLQRRYPTQPKTVYYYWRHQKNLFVEQKYVHKNWPARTCVWLVLGSVKFWHSFWIVSAARVITSASNKLGRPGTLPTSAVPTR